jgi:hypothetical protein
MLLNERQKTIKTAPNVPDLGYRGPPEDEKKFPYGFNKNLLAKVQYKKDLGTKKVAPVRAFYQRSDQPKQIAESEYTEMAKKI